MKPDKLKGEQRPDDPADSGKAKLERYEPDDEFVPRGLGFENRTPRRRPHSQTGIDFD